MGTKVRECPCADISVEKIPIHHTTAFGPEIVLYNSAERVVCNDCNDEAIRIPDMDGLIATAALLRVLRPEKLSGGDLEFIRKAMGLTATDLAAELEVSLESISRWENGKNPISAGNEKLFRLVAGRRLKPQVAGVRYDDGKIFAMKLRACRDADRPVILHLERVRCLCTPDEKPGETYTPCEAA